MVVSLQHPVPNRPRFRSGPQSCARWLAVVCLFGLILAGRAFAVPLVDQPMTGSSAPGWYFGGTPTSALLTGTGAIDPVGNGWLRLTNNSNDQAGYGFFNTAFNISSGVTISFDYATWGGSDADGYSVFLFDGSVIPATFRIGASGGSLGYAQKTVAPIALGLNGGYIGVGIDEYGNFSSPTEGRVGGPGLRANSVSVRGPESTSYAYIGGTGANVGQLSFPLPQNTRPAQTGVQYRKVIIQLTPVPAPNYLRIDVYLQFGAGQAYTQVLSGLNVGRVPPASVKIGYGASTGASTNYHEIRNLIVDPLSTAINLSMTKTASLASITLNSALTYTLKVRNEGPSNVTASNVPIVDTIPPQLTGVTWTCSGTGGASCGAASGSGNALNTTATLPFNGTATYTITGTLTAIPPGNVLTNTATLTVPAGIEDIRPADNSSTVNVSYVGAAGTVTVSGMVYGDSDLSGTRNGAEGTTSVSGIYAKLFRSDGTYLQRMLIPTSGLYSFSGVNAFGTYTIILSSTNNTTFNPSFPSVQWTYVNPLNFTLSGLAVGNTNLTNQDFGVYGGTRVAGRVFDDNGVGGGTANDNAQNGTEVGIYGVRVGICNNTAACTGSTNTIANTLTDTNGDFVLYVPYGSSALTVGTARVAQDLPAGYRMVNYNPGTTTGSAVNLTNGYMTFSFSRGTNAGGILLGDVPLNAFAANNAGGGAPGAIVYYPHTFTPGSGGSLALTVNSRTRSTWPAVTFYRDADCSATFNAGDTPISGPITATADTPICLLTAESIASTATNGQTDVLVTRGTFTYTNSVGPVVSTFDVTDTTTVVASDLSTSTKTWVDLNGGNPNRGDVIRYTITLKETAGGPATGVSVTDNIPANVNSFTVVSIPAGATNNSTGSGTGANGTGYLNITGINLAASSTATIVLDVTISGTAPAGTLINNSATVTNPTGPGATPAAIQITVSVPDLSTSTKSRVDLNGGSALPGDVIRYTITVTESAGSAAPGALVTDNIPANVHSFSVVSIPAGATNSSTGSGTGSHGTGYLNITGINVLANASVTIVFDVTIDTPLASGTTINNSATVTNPVGPGATPAAPQITVVGPNLSTSTKSWDDLNGGDQAPDDVLSYTITLTESAGVDATNVSVTDNIPANLNSFNVVSIPSGATDSSTAAPSGSHGTGYLNITGITVPAGGSVTVVFEVAIDNPLAPLTTIDNSATVTNPNGPGATPSAPTVTVSASAIPVAGLKPLYLYGASGYQLSRTPTPPTSAYVAIPKGGGARTWTESPVLALPVTLSSTVNTTVPVILRLGTNSTRTYNIDVNLACSSTPGTFINDNRDIYLSSTVNTFTFNLPLTTLSCAAGDSWQLTIVNNMSSSSTRDVRVYPVNGGTTSQVRLPSLNVINVDTISYYDNSYAGGGTALTSALPGQIVYIRATVSDPFGSFDINASNTTGTRPDITITDPDGTTVGPFNMTEIGALTDAATKTFEYAYTVPGAGPTGGWTIRVDAPEGTEGTISDFGIGGMLVTWPPPLLTILKSARNSSGTVIANAKSGDVITYMVTVVNTGSGPAYNVILTDQLSAYGAWQLDYSNVGPPYNPFSFTAGTSGLTMGTPDYSRNGGTVWSQTPISGNEAPIGYDGTISNWKLPMTGTMPASGTFTLRYRVRVQ